VDLGLKQLLVESGIDEERDEVRIAPVPGVVPGKVVNFGLMAAKALEEGTIDGFWANGMGAEVAIRRGVGTLVLDARGGDGPSGAFNYTMPALITSDAMIESDAGACAAAVRAIVKTHKALKDDIGLATEVGRKLFPEEAAELIAGIIERDLPFYDASISPEFVAGMNQFQKDVGLVTETVSYEQVVATQFSEYWT
jgi:ABC-type nitrate/sulfonate/bicarbonate transport system substrate-binding protein